MPRDWWKRQAKGDRTMEDILKKALEAVEKLNGEIYDFFEGCRPSNPDINLHYNYENRIPFFDLHTDGDSTIINFIGSYQLWMSDEDEREYDEKAEEYEPLEQFLRIEAQKIIDQLSQIKLLNPKRDIEL